MNVLALLQGLCRAKIRKLVLVVAMAVVIVIVFQCSVFSYEGRSYSLPAREGLNDILLGNATIVRNLKSTKLYAFNVVVNDTYGSNSEEEAQYRSKKGAADSESDSGNETLDDSIGNELPENQSLKVGYNTSRENSFAQVKAIEKIDNSDKNTDLDVNAGNSGLLLGDKAPTAGSRVKHNSKLTDPALKSWKTQPISIYEMNSLLLQNTVSSRSVRPRWSSARDRELLKAKQEIENAPISRSTPALYASVYRNISRFKRSYELMETMLKVYVYKEGEKPIFHQPKMRGIYASEGWFIKLMEGNKKFFVRDPKKAHLFYLPFSTLMLRNALGQNFQTSQDLQQYLKNYVELIAGRYRFWNRTDGADHFLVACHDWAPKLTKYMSNCLRVLCNANAARDFKIGKDTTLPVTYIRSSEAPLENLGGKPPSERPILAFFAGSLHGNLRTMLIQHWENKQPDMKILGPMPRTIEGKRTYRDHMKSSKYCVCARGYEVHTPRVVEAIYNECVPVIISDNYVPPFLEVLNWEAFAVFVREKDVPNLRNILLSIPEEKYLEMQLRVKFVQQHFLWHKKPVKHDLFHMVLHSVWYNRVFHVKQK